MEYFLLIFLLLLLLFLGLVLFFYFFLLLHDHLVWQSLGFPGSLKEILEYFSLNRRNLLLYFGEELELL